MRAEKAERAEKTERCGLAKRVRALSAFSALSALSAFGPSTLVAQTTTAMGRVLVPHAADTVPLPRARVLLHRVGREVQGPVDSTTADAAGRFRFKFQPDTSSLYLLSTRYGGIEYFSPPVATNPARPDTAIGLLAYDTSSTAPVSLEARHIVVPRPAEDGSRSVLDLIVLRNGGILARVAPDSAHPSWSLVLPPGTGEMQVGESDVSPDAVVREGDTVKVLAPLAPGLKQLSIQYATVAARGRLGFPVGGGVPSVNVLVEESEARVSGGTLVLKDSQVIEGRHFRRYAGSVPAGGTITLSLPLSRDAYSRWVLGILVGGVAIALALGAVRLVRRSGMAAPGAAEPEPLLDAIAALDARYLGHEAELPADEWERYRAERSALKARLERALAARGPGPYV